MKKRLITLITTIVMLMSLLQTTALAATNLQYGFDIHTGTGGEGGTDSDVWYGFQYYDGVPGTQGKHTTNGGFEKGDTDWKTIMDSTSEPWMIKNLVMGSGKSGIGPAWRLDWVQVHLPYYVGGGSRGNCGTVGFYEDIYNETVLKDMSSISKRTINNAGQFSNNWQHSDYLSTNDTGVSTTTWDCHINDNYCNGATTYNPFDLGDAPVFYVTPSNTAITAYTLDSTGTDGNIYFSYDKQALFNQMVANDLGETSFKFTLSFPTRSTANPILERTITIYRSCFELGNNPVPAGASIALSPTYSPMQDWNFFNKVNRNVTITTEPVSIYLGPVDATQKTTLAQNFSATAGLYVNRSGGAKICDMPFTNSNGQLRFSGTIPGNFSSGNDGVKLVLANVSSIYDGRVFTLNSGTDLEIPFSTHKVDTISPTVNAVDVDSQPIDIKNSLKRFHQFYMTSNEALYPTQNHNGVDQNYFKYSLYRYNDQTASYSTTPSQITNYDGNGNTSLVKAPINTTVLTDMPINLKLSQKEEGKYRLVVQGWDYANNALGVSDYTDVYIDDKAPLTSVTETVQNQAVDGTKRNDYRFDITDLAATCGLPGAWARVYYCFVPDGTPMPEPTVSQIPSGEIDSVIGQWAFVEGGANAGTAIIKVKNSEAFSGKLYYFTEDSAGNNSRTETGNVFEKPVNILNYDVNDTLQTETSDYPKSNYAISFNDDINLKTKYHWIARDPHSTFNQSYRDYISGALVGAASQPQDAGENVMLDGNYTLEYKVTEQRSGNYKILSKDYSFDNSAPNTNITWINNNLSLLQNQQLDVRANDISGIKSGSYRIVNPDNSFISGCENTLLNIISGSENVNEIRETLTFSLANSGVYGVNILATDKNDYSKTITSADIGLFALRTQKSTITAYNHNLVNQVANFGLTKDDYSLNVTVSEPMANAASLNKEQVVKYCVSTDGSNYGPWITADGKMAIKASSLEHSFTVNKPVTLNEGNNFIFIKTACMNSGDDSTPASSLVSDPQVITIKRDATAPVYDAITYSNLVPTKDDVVGTLSASDLGTGVTTLTCNDPSVAIVKEVDGKYRLTISANVDTSATLSDLLGNSSLIPIKVTNIDKAEPLVSASAEETLSGDRKDSKITVTVVDKNPGNIQFALVEGGILNAAAYDKFAQASTFKVTNTEPVKNTDGLYETVYTIMARGMTGSYQLGAKATDAVGNINEGVIANTAFTTLDVAASVKAIVCNPPISKTTSTLSVTFTTKVAIQEEGQAPSSNYSLTYSTVLSKADPFDLIVTDECGRVSTLTITPPVKFIEGFKTKQTLIKNGDEIENGGFIAFNEIDKISFIVDANTEYSGQKFFMDNCVLDGLTLNEAQSVKDPSDATAYTKLCFDVSRDAKTIKTISFKSYTSEGFEAERTQDEYVTIRTIDETNPEYQMQYNTTAPTNADVSADVQMRDAESDITKLEQKQADGSFAEIQNKSNMTIVFTENGTQTYRITNGAGMTTEFNVSVANIDKAPITEGVDYNVEYRYQDYLGDWKPIIAGKSYRSVMAVIAPTNDSKKTLSATNNSGLSKILTHEENQFLFQIKDLSGNTCGQLVTYDKYDNTVGTTTWQLSTLEKTNQNVTAFVSIIDLENDIVYAEVKNMDGVLYPWKGEPVGNEYACDLDLSGIYTVTAYDYAGNSWSTNITVSNIDKVLPAITRLVYSTPTGTVTSRNVRVDITEFSKPNVKMLGIELGDDMTDSDVVYTAGSDSIRFKKNGYVSVFFQDDYGNIGSDVINVKNIYDLPPQLKAVPKLAQDVLSMSVKFEKEVDESGAPLDIYRELSDLFVTYSGITYKVSEAEVILKQNGEYNFSIFDAAGATQQIKLIVSGIDDVAPKITQISWVYDYHEENNLGIWERKTAQKTLVIGTDTSGKEAGYVVSEDKYHVTNGDVSVTLTTDKDTAPVGSTGAPSKNTSVTYQKNGMYIFNQQARNKTSASYAVDIELIDKTAPIIELVNGPELIFIEGMTIAKDPKYAYDKNKLLDFNAYDARFGIKVDLTSKVKINYGTFNPDDITKNVFDRTSPYYIEYSVYDLAGNLTTIRRTIRLVGFYDTIALVNGVMPDSTNTATAIGSEIKVNLKNFGGISYARYEKGIYTMGQMKTKGTTLVERNGLYTIAGATEGWYTVYIQTDKRDYFNIKIYCKP